MRTYTNSRIADIIQEYKSPNPQWNHAEKIAFSEYLIREICKVILDNENNDVDQNSEFFSGWEHGVMDSADLIKAHFGLELPRKSK